jgi:carbamoyl-phosphate synthase small subunit
MKPDGIFLSNGPGDPASMKKTVAEIKKLTERRVPMFGICLGHQILGQVFGGTTYKLKFGHRGGNQPRSKSRTSISTTRQSPDFSIKPCRYSAFNIIPNPRPDRTIPNIFSGALSN